MRRRGPGRLTALGPPEAAGRWSLVAAPAGSPTERLHATALALLDRHGIVTREAVAGEGIDGGFSAVYPILRALEDAGRIRRGYFIDGLGAAQFALAGAIERLRAVRDAGRGAGGALRPRPGGRRSGQPVRRGDRLAAPGRDRPAAAPARSGRVVVIVDGVAALYLDRGGGSIQVLPAGDDPEIGETAARALGALVADGRARELVITKVDGGPVGESPFRDQLLAAGFRARVSRAGPAPSGGIDPARRLGAGRAGAR